MAGTLSQSSISTSLEWSYWEEGTLSSSFNSGKRDFFQTFSPGTSALQANKVYAAKGTINPSSSVTIDLQTQTDFFGDAYGIDVVRALYLELTTESQCSSILIGGAGVQNPTTAPTLTAIAGGLASGTYKVAYSWKNATGETMVSPTTSLAVNGSQDIRVSALTLPSGATDIYYYCSFASTGNALGYQGTGTGAAYDITSLPATNAAAVPSSNTTGTGVTTLFAAAFDKLRIRNGGALSLAAPSDSAGYAVSSTLKNIRLENEDATYPAHYIIAILGSET